MSEQPAEMEFGDLEPKDDILVLQLGVDAQFVLTLTDTGDNWRLRTFAKGISRREVAELMIQYGTDLKARCGGG